MQLIKICLLFILVYAVSSCNKGDGDSENDEKATLVFGHYYSECGGEACIETFKLTNTELSEDLNDPYAGNGTFDFELLPQEKFDLVDGLISEIPSELLTADDQTFGCPDCGDWGGIFVSWSEDGKVQKWNIDMINDSNPAYLREFVDSINEKIQLINN